MTHKQMDKMTDRQTDADGLMNVRMDGQTGKKKMKTDRQTDFYFADYKNENRKLGVAVWVVG